MSAPNAELARTRILCPEVLWTETAPQSRAPTARLPRIDPAPSGLGSRALARIAIDPTKPELGEFPGVMSCADLSPEVRKLWLARKLEMRKLELAQRRTDLGKAPKPRKLSSLLKAGLIRNLIKDATRPREGL